LFINIPYVARSDGSNYTLLTDGVFSQGPETFDRSADQLFKVAGRIIGGAMQEFYAFGLKPDFTQQPLHSTNTHLRSIVTLGQSTFTLGAGYHTDAVTPSLQGVKQVLHVDLAAAGHFPHRNPYSVLLPLGRQTFAWPNTIAADMHDDIRALGFNHCSHPYF
jgi:hypothetical protein